MAYSPTTWVDGSTPVNASNLNKLERGVESNSSTIDELSAYYGGTVEAMLNAWSATTHLQTNLFSTYGDTSSFLSNGASSSTLVGIMIRNNENFDYMIFRNGLAYIYYGRVSGGEVTALRRISSEQVV